MPVDPSIPLSVNPVPQNQLADIYGTALKIKQLQIDQGEQQYQIEQRNALRQILSQPDAIDPATGRISKNALIAATRAAPAEGIKLAAQNAQIDEREAQTQHIKSEAYQQREKMLSDGAGAAVVAYDEALSAGKSKEAAQAIAQDVYTKRREEIGKSGFFGEDDMSRIPMNFDPIMTRTHAITLEQAIREREAKSREDLATASFGERVKQDATKGEQILTDPKTNTQFLFNPNAPAGRKFTTLDGQPYTPQGAQKIQGGTARSGVAAAMQKFMQENPEATPEQVVKFTAGYTAAIREAGTIGTRTGQVRFGEAELENAAKLSQQAYKKLPRGQFLPFNKLEQKVEQQTSSPDQAAAFAADNTVVNTYARMISPTGVGTQSDKDHAREMLNTAQSQEAHDAVVEQLLKEGKASLAGAAKAKEDAGAEPIVNVDPKHPAGSHPPLALLREGQIAKFPNGQKWTLKNGQAVQVQ